MSHPTPLISILTVNFHSDKKIAKLKESLKGSSIPYEVVVEDNSVENKGFGMATNIANRRAKGKYIFICNPDVVLKRNTLVELIDQVRLLENTAVIAPQLTDIEGRPYLSNTKRLGFWQMLVAHSLINSIWRSNPVSRYYFGDRFCLEESRFVEHASGAALFMPKFMFDTIGGFDEQFFLYFEDADLCNRLLEAGYKIWYEADIKIIHELHGATKNKSQAMTFFRKSRWLYSKKTFGLIPALISEGWIRLWETKELLQHKK